MNTLRVAHVACVCQRPISSHRTSYLDAPPPAGIADARRVSAASRKSRMEARMNARRTARPRATVAGGYTLISGTALLAVWWAYKQQSIRLADLRAWFACCELAAQRRASDANAKFCPGPRHLARLTSTSESAARGAIRRLIASGLLSDAESGIAIPDQIGAHSFAGRERFHHVCSQAPHHARRAPMPRRMLRVLARSARPVLIATVLGHVLRCLFFYGGKTCLCVLGERADESLRA